MGVILTTYKSWDDPPSSFEWFAEENIHEVWVGDTIVTPPLHMRVAAPRHSWWLPTYHNITVLQKTTQRCIRVGPHFSLQSDYTSSQSRMYIHTKHISFANTPSNKMLNADGSEILLNQTRLIRNTSLFATCVLHPVGTSQISKPSTCSCSIYMTPDGDVSRCLTFRIFRVSEISYSKPHHYPKFLLSIFNCTR